jgi:hypothetical protein
MLTLAGTLGREHLDDLLEWFHLTRATGRLLLTTGTATRAFDFVGGRISFASSSHACERLASWLLMRGVADRQTLLKALAISQTQGQLLTAVLEGQAGIGRRTLVNAGRALATTLASQVMREQQVVFRFEETPTVTERLNIDLALDSSKLIIEAAFHLDTDETATSPGLVAAATLDPGSMERLFWRLTGELEGDLVDAGAFATAHSSLLAVGELLRRWVTEGPPLLPVPTPDGARLKARLRAGTPVRIEDSPTLAWDLLALVNSLEAPGVEHAASADHAWRLAGDEAAELVRLVLSSPRWRKKPRGSDHTRLRRAALARAAAGRVLAPVVGLDEEVAATAAMLPVIVLELVITALASTPLATTAMQHHALRQLLPVVGQAAGVAAGLPPVLIAALTEVPADHPGARVAALAAYAAGAVGIDVHVAEPPEDSVLRPLRDPLAAARAAAQGAADNAGE